MKKINADWYSKGKLDRKTWRPTDEKNKFLYSKGFYPTKIKEEDLSKDYIKIRSRTIWYMTGFVKTSGVKDLYYTYLKLVKLLIKEICMDHGYLFMDLVV